MSLATLTTRLEAIRGRLAKWDDPDFEMALPETITLVMQLRDLCQLAKDTLAAAETVAVDLLDGGTIDHNGMSWKTERRRQTQWEADKARDLVDRAKRTVARKVALNPISGELEEDRARVAMATLDEFNRWQTIAARSIKTSTLKAEGIDLDEYAESSFVPTLKGTPL